MSISRIRRQRRRPTGDRLTFKAAKPGDWEALAKSANLLSACWELKDPRFDHYSHSAVGLIFSSRNCHLEEKRKKRNRHRKLGTHPFRISTRTNPEPPPPPFPLLPPSLTDYLDSLRDASRTKRVCPRLVRNYCYCSRRRSAPTNIVITSRCAIRTRNPRDGRTLDFVLPCSASASSRCFRRSALARVWVENTFSPFSPPSLPRQLPPQHPSSTTTCYCRFVGLSASSDFQTGSWRNTPPL